ncbi:glutamate decarboxylase, partial [candidate division GN15 bacterium]|nr:glutamate decarboxylase [candidate division GN15 bacterium]
VCDSHGVWFHVDAAMGGPMLFSEKYRELLHGLDRADSMAWDFHKLIGMPLVCSVVLLHEPHRLQPAVVSSDTEYLFHDGGDDRYDLGVKSLQCGRRVDILKLWLAWQYHGTLGWREKIEHLMDLAAHAEKKVRQSDSLVLAAPRQSISVCFQVKPPEEQGIDRFTIAVRNRLFKSGRALVNYTRLKDGRSVIRLVLANGDSTTEDIDTFFDLLETTIRELSAT